MGISGFIGNTTANQPEVDLVIEKGWPEVVTRIRQLTQCLLYVISDLRENRPKAMSMEAMGQLGLLESLASCLNVDMLSVLTGFEPGPSKLHSPSHPRFDVSLGQCLELSDDEMGLAISSVACHSELLLESVDRLADRPGTLDPTAIELARLYIEIARFCNVEKVMLALAKADLSTVDPGREPIADHFGVGASIASEICKTILPRYLPFDSTISLPADPNADSIIAAFLASQTLLRGDHCYMFRESDFDTSLTHTKNHCTISTGTPLHDPNKLTFDRRASALDVSNTELVFHHIQQQDAPVGFADGLVALAQSFLKGSGQDNFHLQMILRIRELSSTMPLAMTAIELFLASRLPVSPAFQEWRYPPRNNSEFQEQYPHYPKLDSPSGSGSDEETFQPHRT